MTDTLIKITKSTKMTRLGDIPAGGVFWRAGDKDLRLGSRPIYVKPSEYDSIHAIACPVIAGGDGRVATFENTDFVVQVRIEAMTIREVV